ncbi:MAG: hypothetical protein RIQ89_322 [Bacteroidota bacterium]|jgi:inorganic pyrophosphatase
MNLHFHPWHHINPDLDAAATITAVIEIAQGSKAKYEIDKTTGLLRLDRVLYGATHYPINYGIIPQTLGKDHDPLDALVISQVPLEPLSQLRGRIVGVMRMVDNNEVDDKIILAPIGDASLFHIKVIEDLPQHFFSEIKHFFEVYKQLENKKVVVQEFNGLSNALTIIKAAMDDYNKIICSKG